MEPAYLVITSGTSKGTTTDITGWSAGTLTVGDDLSALVTAGDRLEIRRHLTLPSVFDRTNAGSLTAATTEAAADNVQYALTDGSFETFHRDPAPGLEGWRATTGTDENERIIYPEQSFVLKRKSNAALTLFQQGVLNTGGGTGNGGVGATPILPVQTGTNLVTSPADRTVTLADLRLFTEDPATGVASATSAANADRIVVPQPNGTSKTCFHHPTLGWITSAFQAAGSLEFPPGTVFYIIRKAPALPFAWQVP